MKRDWWYYVPHLVLGILVGLLLYRLRLVLAPFVIAYVLAALLDPLVVRMEARGWRRGRAVPCIFAVFLALFAVLLFTALPMVAGQVKQFADNVPGYVGSARAILDSSRERLQGVGIPPYFQELVADHAADVYTAVAQRVASWVQGILGSVGFLIWLVIVPIATYYLLSDIARVRAKLLLLVPLAHRETARAVAGDTGDVFIAYLRGLGTISILYGVTILAMLLAMDMPYGLALGALAGVLYPVPYLGPLITTLTILLVGLVTLGWVDALAAVVAALVANQVFDQLLMPRVVGRSVGLHPVVSMIALLVGADLFGLLGMVVAVPAAGALQVMLLRLLPWLKGEPSEPAGGAIGSGKESRHIGKK